MITTRLFSFLLIAAFVLVIIPIKAVTAWFHDDSRNVRFGNFHYSSDYLKNRKLHHNDLVLLRDEVVSNSKRSTTTNMGFINPMIIERKKNILSTRTTNIQPLDAIATYPKIKTPPTAEHDTTTVDSKQREQRQHLQKRRFVSTLSKQEDDDNIDYIIHNSGIASAGMIRGSPLIGGVTLCSGWNVNATNAFINAIETVVRANPILTGHLYNKGKSLWIRSGTYKPENHQFVNVIDLSTKTNDDENNDLVDYDDPNQLLQYVTNKVTPVVNDISELVSEQIKLKKPLFGATIVLLNNSIAAFAVHMSHAIGDGVTFFHLLKQISLVMSDQQSISRSSIEWNVPYKGTHEFYPPNMSKRDVFIYYGPPFLIGAAKNILSQKDQRQPHFLFLDKQKVNTAKRSLRQQLNCTDISSNDVITSALCQSNPGADIFCFTESIRGIDNYYQYNSNNNNNHKRKKGKNYVTSTSRNTMMIPRNAGGNFIWEIPVSKYVCSNPDLLRKVISSHESGYKTNQLPILPFIQGRHARITSIASVAENIIYNGVNALAVIPFQSTFLNIPLDVAMIFRFNKQYWGILHNFAEFKQSELLTSLLRDGNYNKKKHMSNNNFISEF